MEEKKSNGISISAFFLIIAIMVIIAMGYFIYKFYNDKTNETQRADGLQAQVDGLNGTVNELQGKINDINEITSKDIELPQSSEDDSFTLSVENNIILYDGYEIEIKTGIQDISDMKNTAETKQKFNVSYYNYEDGKYEGITNGIFGDETYEGYSLVSNVRRIAMTQKYNAIPRNFFRTNELPKELMEMADCSSVTIDSIDLDNDGKEEKIVCYTVSYTEDQIGDGEPQASSAIMLFDSDYKKIADLVYLEDGFWAGIREENRKIFLSLDEAEYIDIDNDNVMEIVLKIPTYEGTRISILKYNNGNIEGKTNYKASVLP